MSVNLRKSNSDVWAGMDFDRTENGQQNDDVCIPKLILNCSANSSPQASPKLPHRSRGSKSNSPSAASITTTISEELLAEKNQDLEGSLFIERDDFANRSSESVKSSDASCRTADSSNSCKDVTIRDKKSSDKKRKSSSWYNVLNPTYKSKTEDFKRLFRDLPDTERLIVDYSCAMQKDILVQGRLYISQNFICFYANIFRWETCLTIKCKDITSMTKEKTALVIPNAIQVCTTNEKHFFTSFGARDKTFLMMFRVWQNALLDQPMSPQELWQWIHYSYGDDLGLTSDDDDYVSQTFIEEELKGINGLGSNILRQHSNPNDSFSGHHFGDAPDFDSSAFLPIHAEAFSAFGVMAPDINDDNNLQDDNEDKDDDLESNSEEESNQIHTKVLMSNGNNSIMPNSASSSSVNRMSNDGRGDVKLDELLKNGSLSSSKYRAESPTMVPSDLSESENDVDVEADCGCDSHIGRELINRVFPIPVDTMFEFQFSDSTFFRELQQNRKTTDIVLNDWKSSKEGKIRQISYTVYVNLVGVKTAQAAETQVLHKASKRGKMYIVDVQVLTSGVPYGDHFYTQLRHCITKVSPEECRLRVISEIKYKKNVWPFIKTFIEKNTWAGLEDYFRDLEAFLVKESTKNSPVELPAKSDKNVKYRQKIKTMKVKDNVQVRSESSWASATPELKDSTRSSLTSDVLVPVILLVLILLLILNALLYYKLWALEASSSNHLKNVFPDFVVDPDLLLQKPKSNEEWIKLIHRQETLHQAEIMKWREVIDTVVSLLQQTEDSLISLKHRIVPYSSAKRDETVVDER